MPDIRSPATGAAPAERSHDVSRGVSSLNCAGVSAPAAFSPITFHVLGAPVGKGRARITRNGAFTPAKTRKYEAHVRMAAQQAMNLRGALPLEGPLRMILRADLPIPTSWSKKKRQAAVIGEISPCTRPDVDNYIKAALDACNGIVFADDSQVVRVEAEKAYSLQPKLVVTVMRRTPA